MGLFRLFKGKDAAGYEAAADRHMAQEDWGRAKLALEEAQAKLAKQFPPPGDLSDIQARLDAKHLACKEYLAQGHYQQGKDLMEAGYGDEAKEYFILAQELTEDDTLLERIAAQLRVTPAPQAAMLPSEHEFMADTPSEQPGPTDPPDEYFEALISALPPEVGAAYQGYGSHFQAGYSALNQGDFSTAVSELTLALEEIEASTPPASHTYIPLELATALMNQDRPDEARELLVPFVGHHPDNLPAHRLLCEIYWEQSQFEAAEELLQRLPADLQDSLAYHQIQGEHLQRTAQWAAAETFYRTFLETYGWQQEMALSLAGVLEAREDLPGALAIYTELMAQCQGCGSRVPSMVKRKLADLSMAIGQRTPAILELYLALAQEDPAHGAHYYRQAGDLYDHLGNSAEAERFRQFARQLAHQAAQPTTNNPTDPGPGESGQ